MSRSCCIIRYHRNKRANVPCEPLHFSSPKRTIPSRQSFSLAVVRLSDVSLSLRNRYLRQFLNHCLLTTCLPLLSLFLITVKRFFFRSVRLSVKMILIPVLRFWSTLSSFILTNGTASLRIQKFWLMRPPNSMLHLSTLFELVFGPHFVSKRYIAQYQVS
ncbi:unnamed protein product [Tuber melanosporum]|uniref:(Perigord truffle) hypothetical protein n=1 Tax=Tuber melanosporum (strain Mel28) TaxID=656061 RepID=D5GGS3_TUBMM|nr:uncharacterized protein GSTUM_00007492001 [Tuber melanosporum]CAZ83695.1 unnamed protein product [Tuber melanosporum]